MALLQRQRRPPGHYEVYRVPTAGGPIEAVTALGGVNDFRLSPDDRTLLIEHSELLQPPELYAQPARPGAPARRLTDTVEPAWAAIDWVRPEVLPIPSSHTKAPIWSRVYRPADPVPDDRPPSRRVRARRRLPAKQPRRLERLLCEMMSTAARAAGLRGARHGLPGERGYGRDWRTAIYRQMGHPDGDLADGVAAHRASRGRPRPRGHLWRSTAASSPSWPVPAARRGGRGGLRPVTDWSNYNDGYTTPSSTGPKTTGSYRRSSPIEFAEGLEDPLLIRHGMVDNVPYQDSVRLAQRLIELEKTDWELAQLPGRRATASPSPRRGSTIPPDPRSVRAHHRPPRPTAAAGPTGDRSGPDRRRRMGRCSDGDGKQAVPDQTRYKPVHAVVSQGIRQPRRVRPRRRIVGKRSYSKT